jgi:hypothetical protein
LAHPAVDDAVKLRLRGMYSALDPVALLAQIRDAQNDLGQRVHQRAGKVAAGIPAQIDMTAFARTLGENWKVGEHRVIHRRPYVRRKPIPRRPSMLDPYVPLLEEWLAATPHLSAVDILTRLATQVPDRFGKGQLRTMQRLVKKWRARTAHQLISSAGATITIGSPSAAALAIPADTFA